MTAVKAIAATSASRPLEHYTITRRELEPDDVLIEIAYAGICHTDIHSVRGDWGEKQYPLVPGHEIAGVVTKVGAAVTKHAVGDRVGIGCLVDSCRTCANCLKGQEQYCLAGNTATYGATDRYGEMTQGGYSTHIVASEHFVLKIPDAVPLDAAAPLLCAGVTTYSPLKHWKVGPGSKIAIVGLGGLGHMAVKLARALGAEVTVLSQTLAKQDDGLRLGAHHFHATSDPETFARLRGSFELILNTVSAPIDVDAYLSLLSLDGALVNLGAPAEPMSLDVFSLLRGRKSYAGSIIGGIPETQEMLEFCAEHGIGSDIEVITASEINVAFERVLASDVRYRFVIDISTLNVN
ncbi:dehydrogenase [Arthrobacter sp. StoSoilB3]|nr:dehydrogenase [Arthrobacter sp. StoSoilB3]